MKFCRVKETKTVYTKESTTVLGTTYSESTQTDDMIYNWRNSLRKNDQGERIVAAQVAQQLKSRDFNENEAIDMMIADGYSMAIAKAAVEDVYEVVTAQTSYKPQRTAMVVPTKYNDVAPIIEDTLKSTATNEFINLLTTGEQPIMRLSRKGLDSFSRLVKAAKEDKFALETLHGELKPWIEEAMLNSVLLAEKTQARIFKAESEGQYKVSTAKGVIDVDLESGTSSGSRFQKGNFAQFGLADEYLVKVADTVSPHARLTRAIVG